MNIEFSTVRKKIIYSQKISTISILLLNNQSIKLLNIAFVPECKSNLIFFS